MLEFWNFGPPAPQILEFGDSGILAPRNVGMLEFGNFGLLDCWNVGISEFRIVGISDCWNVGISESGVLDSCNFTFLGFFELSESDPQSFDTKQILRLRLPGTLESWWPLFAG